MGGDFPPEPVSVVLGVVSVGLLPFQLSGRKFSKDSFNFYIVITGRRSGIRSVDAGRDLELKGATFYPYSFQEGSLPVTYYATRTGCDDPWGTRESFTSITPIRASRLRGGRQGSDTGFRVPNGKSLGPGGQTLDHRISPTREVRDRPHPLSDTSVSTDPSSEPPSRGGDRREVPGETNSVCRFCEAKNCGRSFTFTGSAD